MIGSLLGGIGLFLLGMGLLTDGLQAAAGDSLRNALRKYTRSRLSGVAMGALFTTLVQSSSATTLAVIGFVGAGLLPFAQGVSVIYGANVGTTTTGWIISLVGLNLKMSTLALPLVGLGAMAKLFLRGRRAALGTALAGFGLLFVGIDVLQVGMQGLSERVDPAKFASDSLGGRVLLVMIGFAMTVVMQSSSAAVATTLTALHGGALTLEQAAAVVIGQNVGTTLTAMVGAIGGSVPAKRIALVHVAFNVGTGLLALIMLPLFVVFVVRTVGDAAPAVALSAFHTAFNLLGLLVFLPLSGRLVRLLERLIPEKGHALTQRLSRSGADIPAVAVEAARLTTIDIANAAFSLTRAVFNGQVPVDALLARREELREALLATREHLSSVRSDPATPQVYREHVSVLHALDHLHRIVEALGESQHAHTATTVPAARDLSVVLASGLTCAIENRPEGQRAPSLEDTPRAVAEGRQSGRKHILELTARGALNPHHAEAQLEALRWIERLGYHAFRALHHLEHADRDIPHDAPSPDEVAPPELSAP